MRDVMPRATWRGARPGPRGQPLEPGLPHRWGTGQAAACAGAAGMAGLSSGTQAAAPGRGQGSRPLRTTLGRGAVLRASGGGPSGCPHPARAALRVQRSAQGLGTEEERGVLEKAGAPPPSQCLGSRRAGVAVVGAAAVPGSEEHVSAPHPESCRGAAGREVEGSGHHAQGGTWVLGRGAQDGSR